MRLALDAPEAVTHLAVLDSVPIAETLDRTDARFATAWWHWFFFAQPDKPEQAILADPDAWYGGDKTEGWVRRTTPTTAGRSMTRQRCTRCSRTIAPAWAPTERPTRPTALPAAGSPARR